MTLVGSNSSLDLRYRLASERAGDPAARLQQVGC